MNNNYYYVLILGIIVFCERSNIISSRYLFLVYIPIVSTFYFRVVIFASSQIIRKENLHKKKKKNTEISNNKSVFHQIYFGFFSITFKKFQYQRFLKLTSSYI